MGEKRKKRKGRKIQGRRRAERKEKGVERRRMERF